jgi:DNA mismatch repair protein MutL
MTRADLQAAFTRHATSKLDRVEDLLHIASLGFRGEALASIGAVSRARITSRPAKQSEGAVVENKGGAVAAVRPAPSPLGTKVEVADLFYNIPARLKFLKADATELSHVVEAVTRMLLAFPGIEVGLSHNGRSVLSCERSHSLVERIERCFGKDLAGALLPVEGASSMLRMSGYVGRPEAARKDRRRSYLFVNGRYVSDKVVHAAISRAFRERLPARLQPVYFLNLSLPHEDVDVNVHPMKMEVRFRDGTHVFAAVLGMIEDALASREREASATPWVVREAPRFTDRAAGAGARASGPPAADGTAHMPGRSGTHRLAFGLPPAEGLGPGAGSRVTMRPAGRFLQVHDGYLVFEVAEGIAVVDQHALHERVIYHRLKEQYESGGVLLQKLLVPARLEVEAGMAHRTDEIVLELARLGIEAEPFGPASIKVTAIPHLARRTDPQELTRGIMEELIAGSGGEDAYDGLLHSIACRAAVKAGDRLEEDELSELAGFLETVADASHCPHGRPTTILLTLRELEEMFKRRGF